MSRGNIFLGTSGWSYKEWEEVFYQKGEKRKLRAYSQVFQTAEIDSTFYRYPSKGTVMGWLKYSPSEFVFTAKLPKVITHDKKLGLKGDVKADLDAFLELMRPLQLGGKLACLRFSFRQSTFSTLRVWKRSLSFLILCSTLPWSFVICLG